MVATTAVAVTTAVDRGEPAIAAPSFSASDIEDEFVASGGWFGVVGADWLADGRLLMVQLAGDVVVVDPATGQGGKFFTIPGVFSGGEVGLLDVTVDPDHATNGHFYTYLYDQSRRIEVSRFTMKATGAETLATRTVLWTSPGPTLTELYHGGGSINFGPDGKLYLTTGDGALPSNSQSLGNVFGKALRINPDGSIPTDNPFYDGDGPNVDAIWAYGFRNSYRSSFDPVTGTWWVADVGGNDPLVAYEEINHVEKGRNYGWPLCEGPIAEPKEGTACPSGVSGPAFSYSHVGAVSKAIIGGMVYRGGAFPAPFNGDYVYADFGTKEFFWAEQTANGMVSGLLKNVTDASDPLDPVWMDTSPVDGHIYWLGLAPNYETKIHRLRYVGSEQRPPVISSAGASTSTAAAHDAIRFSAAATDADGDPISYEWSFGDGSTSTDQNPTHSYAAPGAYRVQLTVSSGADRVVAPTINVQIGTKPSATIVSPADRTVFSAGDHVDITGSATDADDGVLPASSLSWTVTFKHDEHTHPLKSGTGAAISLDVPTTGHDYSGDTGYVVTLTATDSSGLTGTSSILLLPVKVDVAVTSNIAVQLEIGGITRTAPTTLETIDGFETTVSAPSSVCVGAQQWVFGSWSDGGARSHTYVGASGDLELSATYLQQGTCAPPTGFPGAIAGGSTAAPRTPLIRPSSPVMNTLTSFTLSAWVNPTDSIGEQAIVSRSASPWEDQQLFLGTTGGWLFGTITTDASGAQLFAGGTLPTGTWSHVALTYDGSNLVMYVGGREVGRAAASGRLRVDADDAGLIVGGRVNRPNGATTSLMSGLVAPGALFGRALSASEIATQFAQGRPEDSAPPPTPTTTTTAPTTTTTLPATTIPTATTSSTTTSTATTAAPTTTTVLSGDDSTSCAMTTRAQPVTCPAPAALNTAAAISWSAWVRLDATTGSQVFVSRPASPWGDQSFVIGAYSGWLYTQVTTSGTSAQLFGGGAISPGVWTHLAATYDGTQVRFYVNGVPAGSKSASGAVRADSASAPIVAGGSTTTAANGAPGSAVQGIVAPAIVHGRALTASEIAAAYGAGRPGTNPGQPTTTTAAPTTSTTPATTTTVAPTTTTAVASTTAVPTTTTPPSTTTVAATTSTAAPTTTTPTTTTTTGSQPGAALSGSMTTPGVAVSVPATPTLTGATTFTVSAWARVTSTTGDQTFIARPASPWGDQTFLIGAYSGWLYTSVTTRGTGAQLFGGGTIPLDTWTHVALTYDGTSLSMYVNGALVGTKTATGLPRTDNPTAAMVIGGRSTNSSTQPTPTGLVNGIVDPARFHDRVLSAAEIRAEFSRGR